MPLQLWIQAWRRGLRVRETPVKLIYKDATRQFGGMLNDPEARLRYYNDAIEDELMRSEQNGISMRKVRQTVGY
jgi:dolichol-phosphate mannosyltransferase